MKYLDFFPNYYTVFPVIHSTSLRQTVRNAIIAKESQADGIFVINHGLGSDDLRKFADFLTDVIPGWFVAMNCLGEDPFKTLKLLPEKVSGIWVDNANIDETKSEQKFAKRFIEAQKDWNGLYFGGVAFKYQKPVDNVGLAAQVAMPYMDVITTSGPGTGKAAPLKKIKLMREAIGDFPLAIASGITPDNVNEYLPYANSFLVATGISESFDELDPFKVQQLVEQVHSY